MVAPRTFDRPAGCDHGVARARRHARQHDRPDVSGGPGFRSVECDRGHGAARTVVRGFRPRGAAGGRCTGPQCGVCWVLSVAVANHVPVQLAGLEMPLDAPVGSPDHRDTKRGLAVRDTGVFRAVADCRPPRAFIHRAGRCRRSPPSPSSARRSCGCTMARRMFLVARFRWCRRCATRPARLSAWWPTFAVALAPAGRVDSARLAQIHRRSSMCRWLRCCYLSCRLLIGPFPPRGWSDPRRSFPTSIST